MKVIVPGHTYVLESIDGVYPQGIVFVKRVGDYYPGNTGQPHAGTTIQEVCRMLLDRVRYVNGQISCLESELILGHLNTIIALCEFRAARVHGRVLDIETIDELEHTASCKVCGHLQCEQHEAT
jgi:hypothetical protein